VKIVVFGLSVTSSWGNGHATTYRALLSGLHRRKHRIIFFEKNEEWYASNRDLPIPDFCEVRLFENWGSCLPLVRRELSDCDVAVLGSFFPEGVRAADELACSRVPVKAFYDIDTPITLEKLKAGGAEYLRTDQVPGFDLYLSFTAGPILQQLQTEFRARQAQPLFCSFEPEKYYPRRVYKRYECDLSYMGTYAADRQRKVDELFVLPARNLPNRKFILAGPQYPSKLKWPKNVRGIRHLSPRWHPHFYSSSRLTLNLTRQKMIEWGYSPSVRLFEAAACGCPIVSDSWPGLETILRSEEEVLVANNSGDVATLIEGTDDAELRRIGRNARERVLAEHSAEQRAQEFENYVAVAPKAHIARPQHGLLPRDPQSRRPELQSVLP
jgi:spore maturation protein CgeB